MTPQTRTSLKELQNLDQAIAAIRSSAQSFDLLLEEVNAPVARLEQEVEALEKRLTELKLEENRIELTIEERRVRAAKLQERMDAVRNVREEAAVHAELEMVRRALESEEQEALSLLDQIKRLEERSEEQEAAYQEALAEVEPHREELVEEQQSADGKLEALQAERDAFAAGIDPGERRIYDSIMAGARDVAVAELTQDGACGNCYNMVPLQIQNQIRHGEGMIRCEGCGVILTPESEEGLARAREEGERIERALKASTDQRDEERAALSEAEASEAEALEEAEQAAIAEATTAEASAAGPISDDPAPDMMSDSVFDTLAAEVAIEGQPVASDGALAEVLGLKAVTEDVVSNVVSAEELAIAAVTEDAAGELVFEDVASDDAPADESAVENGDDVPAEEPADDDADAGEVADADAGIVAEEAEPRKPTTDDEWAGGPLR